jgi:hypothetical protein
MMIDQKRCEQDYPSENKNEQTYEKFKTSIVSYLSFNILFHVFVFTSLFTSLFTSCFHILFFHILFFTFCFHILLHTFFASHLVVTSCFQVLFSHLFSHYFHILSINTNLRKCHGNSLFSVSHQICDFYHFLFCLAEKVLKTNLKSIADKETHTLRTGPNSASS